MSISNLQEVSVDLSILVYILSCQSGHQILKIPFVAGNLWFHGHQHAAFVLGLVLKRKGINRLVPLTKWRLAQMVFAAFSPMVISLSLSIYMER
jgi:hypothetical protein